MNQPKKGYQILHNRKRNKSTAFTKTERLELGLKGLLPYAVTTQAMQIERIMENIRRKEFDIERYVLLNALQDRNEMLFYQTMIQHINEIMPIIYTPTVGQACVEYSHIFRQSKGLFITPDDKGEIDKILDNWPEEDIRVIVVTDGERILGLGDLGANGMGIPIGKLALYIACAGIQPHQCLPVMLDVGTGNQQFLSDPLYIGYPHSRIKGQDYLDLVEEFIMSVQNKYPNALIQFEDFLTPNAYALLRKYRDRVLCFNDDIQGTAAVALAGIYASSKITGHKFSDLTIMFLGAGSAATGIADLMVLAFQDYGLSKEEAYSRLHFVDVNGLVVSSRTDLMEHNLPYAKNSEQLGLVEAIDAIKPHVLIGATGVGGTFTKEVIEHMAANHERPVVFALSNPTDRAECTAEQAYNWSNGKVVFASGSPFEPLTYGKQNFRPGQGNNAYIFPGIGLAAVTCSAQKITESMFLTAAKALAESVSDEDIMEGALYPPLKNIRNVSLKIAAAVAEKTYHLGLAGNKRPENIEKMIVEYMYNPKY